MTAYTTIGEAYRSDRWACFQPQPDPGGILLFQYGIHNYLSIRPADEAGDCDGVTTALGARTGVGRRRIGLDDGQQHGAGHRWRSSCSVRWCSPAEVWAMRRRSTAADRE